MTRKHLWEVERSKNMATGNHFPDDCHEEWSSWAEFLEEMGDADLDMNFVVRWDWLEPDPAGYGTAPYKGDDSVRYASFVIQIVFPRKARLTSHSVSVCRGDEAAILEYLRPRWAYMQETWAPFTGSVE